MAKPPRTIYLQWYGSGPTDTLDEIDHEDVSWCADKIWDNDLAYVRAGKSTADLEAKLKQAEATLKAVGELAEKWREEARKVEESHKPHAATVLAARTGCSCDLHAAVCRIHADDLETVLRKGSE